MQKNVILKGDNVTLFANAKAKAIKETPQMRVTDEVTVSRALQAYIGSHNGKDKTGKSTD